MSQSPAAQRVRRPAHELGWLAVAHKGRIKGWLRSGLHGWFLEPPLGSPSSFAPATRFIGRTQVDDLATDLAAIYHRVPEQRQVGWRRAAAELISELPARVEYAPILETLLNLARSMPAYSVLARVPGRMDDTDFGIMETRATGGLFGTALETALDLTVESPAAAKSLLLLVGKPGFGRYRHYARLILVALCRADPDRWWQHVVLLTDFILDTAEGPSMESDTRLTSLVTEIVDLVGLARIARHLNHLYLMGPESWFAAHMFLVPGSEFYLDANASAIRPRHQPGPKFILHPRRNRKPTSSNAPAGALSGIPQALRDAGLTAENAHLFERDQ
jgi:hypothetical protein